MVFFNEINNYDISYFLISGAQLQKESYANI